MRSPLIILAVAALLPACKKTPEQQQAEEKASVAQVCNSMTDLSLAYVAGVTDTEVESLDSPGTRDKLREACKALPLKVAQCAARMALDDPECDKALEQHLGMTDSAPQGRGPEPRWAVALPFEVYDLEAGPGGRVAIAGDTGLAVIADGKVAWSTELEDASSRVGWMKDTLVTAVRGELRAYDDTGAVAWTASLSAAGASKAATGEGAEDEAADDAEPADDDEEIDELDAAPEDGGDAMVVTAIEPGPGGLVTVVTRAGTILRLDGKACAAKAEGCVTTVGTDDLLGGMVVSVLDGGALLGSDDEGIVLVSADGKRLAHEVVDYETSIPQGDLVVAKNDIRRADPSCEPEAPSCLEVVLHDDELDLPGPVELPGIGIAYADQYGVIYMKGTREWKVDAGNDGDLVTDGRTIYSVGHQLGLGDALEAPPQVRAIDPNTGGTRWITPLGKERAGLLSGYVITLRDDSLLVATKSQLFALPLDD